VGDMVSTSAKANNETKPEKIIKAEKNKENKIFSLFSPISL
jgi:hypothetical protein